MDFQHMLRFTVLTRRFLIIEPGRFRRPGTSDHAHLTRGLAVQCFELSNNCGSHPWSAPLAWKQRCH